MQPKYSNRTASKFSKLHYEGVTLELKQNNRLEVVFWLHLPIDESYDNIFNVDIWMKICTGVQEAVQSLQVILVRKHL